MKTDIQTNPVITVELSYEEAKWLRDMVQNPHPLSGAVEPPQITEMRNSLFHALKDCTERIAVIKASGR